MTIHEIIKEVKRHPVIVKVIHKNYEDWFYDEEGPPVISVKAVNGEILISCDAREVTHNPLVQTK